MADRDALRRVLLSRGFRRSVLVVLIAVSLWFVYRSLEQGSVADRCAGELSAAVASKDRSYLTEHVRNPSLVDRLLEAPHAELAFVRPMDPEWSRIGFLIRDTATATAAKPLFVLLAHDESRTGCSFIQDYDAN